MRRSNSGEVGRGKILEDPAYLTFLGKGGVCFSELAVKYDIVGFMLYKYYALLMNNSLHDGYNAAIYK